MAQRVLLDGNPAVGYSSRLPPLSWISGQDNKPARKGTSFHLVQMVPEHYPALYEVSKRAYTIPGPFQDFKNLLDQSSGFTVRKDARIIGTITFSGWVPGHDIVIHCFIDPEFHSKWALRRHFRSVFGYCFTGLQLKRITGFSVPEVSDKVEKLLSALGFKYEGTLRQKIKHPDGKLYDMKLFGLLKDERIF